MKKTFKSFLIIAAALFAIAVAAGLFYLPSLLGDSAEPASDADALSAVPAASVITSVSEADARITFSDSGVAVTGSSAFVKTEGSSVTVSVLGVYLITGSLFEGSVKVKKGTTGVVLILQDLDLACSTTAPLSLNKATSTAVYISGTVTLTDSEDEANDTGAQNSTFEGAAIKVKSGSSAIICGDGVLNIAGNCKNGIKGAASSDITVSGSLTLNISSVNNALASDGSLTVDSGTVNIVSQNGGVKSDPDDGDSASAGILTVNGGTVSVTAAGKGFSANEIIIKGGSISVDSEGDAFHADIITVSAGDITVSTGDDALHADSVITVGTDGSESGPRLSIVKSHEGLEAVTINLFSGYGAIVADDDGLNATGGTQSSGFASAASSGSLIKITGGYWYIDSCGDGIDSNGDVSITGGSTVVYGSTDNGNAAFDYDGTATLTGGEVLAVGMSGMAQAPGGTVVSFNYNLSAGAVFVIKDSSGNEIISSGAIKAANSVIYASASLVEGETYTLYVNGAEAASVTAGAYSGSFMGGFGFGGGPGGHGGPGGGRGGN